MLAAVLGDGANENSNPFFCVQITKKRASHKPTYENLQKSLEAMKSHCLKNGVTDLSMPRQGNPELIGEV